MESESLSSNIPLFPDRQVPRVIEYSLKSVYASIYSELKDAFDKDTPFLTLAIYNTESYDRDPNKQVLQSQKMVIGLIRTLLLKRLESSFKAFEASVEDLLAKMADFLKTHSFDQFEIWEKSNKRWWAIVQQHILERLEREESEEEDEIPDEESDFNPAHHDMVKLSEDLKTDMELLTTFLSKIYRRFYIKDKEGSEEDPSKDDKLLKLVTYLRDDSILKGHKVLIFSEFRDTARYLYRHLKKAGFTLVEQIDSGRNIENREKIIKRFAPYYNCIDDPCELEESLNDPINILISTDVLSEGLNLQDASLIINYDLHWNPVRLMQRIGRIDRRLNSQIESQLKRPRKLDKKVYFWNFLPPAELEDLLHLKQRLDGKILRINKTLGIEGALLTPDDPNMTLKLFNEKYEGRETIEELMQLEWERMQKENPALSEQAQSFPRRIFSGKSPGDGFKPIVNRIGKIRKDIKPCKITGVLFCYMIPDFNLASSDTIVQESNQCDQGEVRWYFYESETGKIIEGTEPAWCAFRSTPDTPRHCVMPHETLSEIRKKIEKHIKNSYLKSVQAPQGVKPILKAWMELS